MSQKTVVSCLAWLLFASALSAQPAQVMIIRHAEKPEHGHCLSVNGWERAGALVPFFLGTLGTSDCGTPEAGFGKPVAIFAQRPSKENGSLRPMQTVQALALALKLDLVTFVHDDYEKMAHEILTNSTYRGKNVLICWEHHAIPDVAVALGVKNPPKWKSSVFDRLWVITFKNEKARLRSLPQQLMYGDSED
jgi:hypothetical protein